MIERPQTEGFESQRGFESGSPDEGRGVEGPHIESFTLGPFETNCYLVREAERSGARAWVVDVSFEPGEMIRRAKELGVRVEAIVLTHAHVDHIAGIPELLSEYPGTPIWIHEAEREWLGDPERNLSALMGLPVSVPGAARLMKDGEEIAIGDCRWTVLHTPGHSPGGIGLYHAGSGALISGDALFAGSIGRTDFPGCDHQQLLRSIREKYYILPGETRVFPGHGAPTTIGRERKSNPFVRA